jgi:transcription elongation factor GreA
MGYLEDFQEQLDRSDFRKFFQLWEEYCTADVADADELIDLLNAIKKSELAKTFGQYVETALPLWQTITDDQRSYQVLGLLIDLQNTNSALLGDVTFNALEKRHGMDPEFQRRLKLVGMRPRANFQSAINAYELLTHMAKGKFVFHAGGWGAGEIVDVSPIREEVIIEFENLTGRKSLSFQNAFKTVVPLEDSHFLARRFANPDELEEEARRQPVEVIKLLLKGLGPKNAVEIKDELCELVIPEKDWAKWWQGTRSRLKKDTLIETPDTLRAPFKLRRAAVSHEELFKREMSEQTALADVLMTTYNFVRDMPDVLKKAEVKASLQEKLLGLLDDPTITPAQKLQVQIFLEQHFGHRVQGKSVAEVIQKLPNVDEVVNDIEILAFKKRALMAIREHRPDWTECFLKLFDSVQQNALRDYILKELKSPNTLDLLNKKIKQLLNHPTHSPEVFIWYFQKVIDGQDVPLADKRGQGEFMENFLILFSILEAKPEFRDLIKKMYAMLSGKRFQMVRQVIEGTSLEFIQEFLLLVSKCRTLSDHDKKILRSLAEVVHPELADKKRDKAQDNILWTTEEGYQRTKERLQQVGTVEIVENAREIEAARAHGDLRENSEYKFALERRARLQGELKSLSEQINRARVITKDDISLKEVGIGSRVDLVNKEGVSTTYTILGPWDADPDRNILSAQSKLAESMMGKKVGDAVKFRDEEFKIAKLQSYLS